MSDPVGRGGVSSPVDVATQMLPLRWTLGVAVALVAIGAFALLAVAGGFRRSFGASDNPAINVVPVVAGALVLASLVWPERRALLHVVAALMLAMAVGAVLIARQAPVVATLALAYGAAWLAMYWRMVRA